MADDLLPKKRASGLPKRWFFTDDVRVPDPLQVIKNLDPKIGVIVRNRHYDLIKKIADLCLKQKRLFLIKDPLERAKEFNASGLHLSEKELNNFAPAEDIGFITAACHSKKTLNLAQSLGVDGVFISPIFATDSHPDKLALTDSQIMKILDGFNPSFKKPDIFALGGMTEKRFQQLKENPHFKAFSGYGAIGDFLP